MGNDDTVTVLGPLKTRRWQKVHYGLKYIIPKLYYNPYY